MMQMVKNFVRRAFKLLPKSSQALIKRAVESSARRVAPSLIVPLDQQLKVVRGSLFNSVGQFNTTKNLDPTLARALAQYYSYHEWSRLALDVANQYGGGDYLEFGSEGLNTLCNFMAAFHLQGFDELMPDVRFYAFDVFGDPDENTPLTTLEEGYFNSYKKGGSFFAEMQKKLDDFGLMRGRVELIKGFFKDTLNESFRDRLRSKNRHVGFAFIDCNLPSSYKTVFDFLLDFFGGEKNFVYIDEYFQIPGVAKLFDDFSAEILVRYGKKARYVRPAGAYGALFHFISDQAWDESKPVP